MPEKNGLEFLYELKAKQNTIPVIVLSNVSSTKEQNEVRSLGVNVYLVKVETSLKTLIEKVEEVLGG